MDTNKNTEIIFASRDTIALYRFIYQKAQLGMGTLGKIQHLSDTDSMNEILVGQRKGYTAFLRNAANALALCGERPCGMSAYEKLRTCLMIRLNTANGKKQTDIAGFLITVVTLSSIEGTRIYHQLSSANEESKELMQRFLRFQDANYRKLKEFL